MHGQLTHVHELYTSMTTHATLSYAPGSDVKLDVELKAPSIYPLSVSGDVALTYPGRELRLYKAVEEPSTGVYNTETIAKWQAGKQVR